MTNQTPKRAKPPSNLTPQQYARLKSELATPYRGLRLFIYLVCGASGFIGALIFLGQLAAGRDVYNALPNFALQLGVVALMVWFFRLDKKSGTPPSP
jgi:hypothetical protein